MKLEEGPDDVAADASQEIQSLDNQKITIFQQIRGAINKLGIPGLAAYNIVRSGLVGIGAAYLVDENKLTVGTVAAGVNLVASQTFWVMTAMIAAKAYKSAKSSPKP